MSNTKKPTTTALPSSNWLALQKTLKKRTHSDSRPHKRRKIEHGSTSTTHTLSPSSAASSISTPRHPIPTTTSSHNDDHTNTLAVNTSLQNMVKGTLTYTPSQQQPGRFLAIDCEMVGIGIDGEESSLARVSLVNWHGAVQLDCFVRQRERVVDYRTRWSGIREKDMIGAKPFEEVQQLVADMLKDRILIGHAVHNDLKALLLSHPHQMTRDTQIYARKHELTKSKYISLRNLVKEQLGLTIQEGEHSSVTDARAAMAIYRLHKKEWEKGKGGIKPTDDLVSSPNTNVKQKKKRKRGSIPGAKAAEEEGQATQTGREESDDADDDADVQRPTAKGHPPNNKSKARKGISSGLSTVIKRRGPDRTTVHNTVITAVGRKAGRKATSTSTTAEGGGGGSTKKPWWTELPSGGAAGRKGSIRL